MESASSRQIRLEAVLFDYGLVLTGPPVAAAWTRMREILGFDESTLYDAYWAPRHDYDRGLLNGTLYWEAVGRRGGLQVEQSQVEALSAADTTLWTQPNQPMIDWARRLQKAGIRTGILSNLGDEIMSGVLATFDWFEHFDHRTFSHALGIAKPEGAIYRYAADGLGCAPDTILFVDDRAENIAGALATGMQAIRYVDHAGFLAEMHSRGLDWLLYPARNVTESQIGTE